MAAHPLRIGLKPGAQDVTPDELRAVWRIADDAGFDHLWDHDHLQSFSRAGGTALPIFEGWTLLAAMAEATRRVRIGCLGHRQHLPASGRAGQDGGHGRPPVGRPAR